MGWASTVAEDLVLLAQYACYYKYMCAIMNSHDGIFRRLDAVNNTKRTRLPIDNVDDTCDTLLR